MKREDLGVKRGESDSATMLGWVLMVVLIAIGIGLFVFALMS